MRVFVYRNLNRKGVIWSVRDTKTGRVIDRAKTVVIKDPHFHVNEKGRLRAVAARRRNVHAGVRGERRSRAPKGNWRPASYNPYFGGKFLYLSDSGWIPIESGRYARLTSKGLQVIV